MNNKSMSNKSIHFTIIIIFCCAFLLTACDFSKFQISNDAQTKYGTYFDTFVSISIYGKTLTEAENILDKSFEIFDKYERMMSVNIEDSDIYKINHSNLSTVSVNPETIDLINKSIEYSEQTEGLFDITVYTILNKYDFHEGNYSIPTEDEITNALPFISYKAIQVDEQNLTITLNNNTTMLDIGGIAKGYIADKVAEYLTSENVTGAIINVGGDIRTIGCKPDGSSFQIGISDPINTNNTICGISINNKSVATSGTYIRSFTLDDNFYHHIINPKNGLPADTDLISTTVISSNATDCDTLCTILILLGSRDALTLIESIPDTETIMIKNDGSIIKSSGASSYIK